MVSHAFAALIKKRAALAEKEKGFTLIELLVTVIIIGVLAAIAIPMYLNVQDGAKNSAVQSDLTTAKTAVITAQTSNSNVELFVTHAEFQAISPAPSGANYTTLPLYTSNGVSGTSKATVFCISAKSKSGSWFAITDKVAVTENQSCSSAGLMEPKAKNT